MITLIKQNAQTLFGQQWENLAEVIPILRVREFPFNFDAQDENNFALLDFVSYDDTRVSAYSVNEHFDPGLLSLNVLNTQPGLVFRSGSEEVEIPTDPEIGVVWTGISLSLYF